MHCIHGAPHAVASTVLKKNNHKTEMKVKTLLVALLAMAGIVSAQTDDPVIMTVNGKPVTRSEFEYSYNKNNEETVVDKKSVNEYVDLFVNFKLKVLAAEAAGIDTTADFRKEFRMYRDQQLRPTFINDNDLEQAARRVYAETKKRIDDGGGLVRVSHVLVRMPQKATQEQQEAARHRADSIYNVLKGGADFAKVAGMCSDDKVSAARGGDINWVQRGVTFKEFEDKVFQMPKGTLSKPFMSPAGYHIALVTDRRMFLPYDSVHADILRFVGQQRMRESIISDKLDSIAKASVPPTTVEEVLDKRADELSAKDSEMRNLIREYHDGLLFYDISNRTVWEKAAKDDAALEAYFKKNKKKYAWDEPRYKGIAYHTRSLADVKKVQESIKKVDFKDWADTLRKEFNDSVVRIKVVKGIFKKGENALVDKMVFGKDTTLSVVEDFPHEAVYGKLMKNPKSYLDVRDLVVSDYQEELEKQWVAELRRKYPVWVDKQVLETVNKH